MKCPLNPSFWTVRTEYCVSHSEIHSPPYFKGRFDSLGFTAGGSVVPGAEVAVPAEEGISGGYPEATSPGASKTKEASACSGKKGDDEITEPILYQ